MLFIIVLGVLITGIVFLVLYNNDVLHSNAWENAGVAITFVGAIALVVTLTVFGFGHLGQDGYVAENKQRYETIIYQYKNNMYDNDNDLGKKELMNQIQDWNEDLAWYRANQQDFWIGIFIPNIFDQFEFIDLEGQQ